MSEKEPGKLAHDNFFYINTPAKCWADLSSFERANFVRVESAIRADEAAKVRAATIEECAKVAADEAYGFAPEDLTGHGVGYDRACKEIANAIRALGDKAANPSRHEPLSENPSA
jgi:hypothetical protein